MPSSPQPEFDASIIVINHEGLPYLESCLSSLYEQDYQKDRFEVILLDNASLNGSVDRAEKRYPLLRIVRSKKNLGYAGGANLGARVAKGELLVFLNNDVRMHKEWLRKLILAADLEKREAIVGSKILQENTPQFLNQAGGLLSHLGTGFDIGFGMRDRVPEGILPVGYVSGAALMIPRRLFEKLGGFDESYFIYCEDVDLCWRAWLGGHKVVVQTSAILFHSLHSMKSESTYWSRFFHWHKNALVNILKNLGVGKLLLGLTLHTVLLFTRIFSAIRWISPRRVVLLFQAYAWVLMNMRPIMTRRALVQASRKFDDHQLAERGLFIALGEVVTEGRRMFRTRLT